MYESGASREVVQILSEPPSFSTVRQIGLGLKKYLWLKAGVGRREVSRAATFQRRFNDFYRVRRNAESGVRSASGDWRLRRSIARSSS